MKRPTRHSYSSISTYQECPARYKYDYIDKLPGEESAAMMRGTRLHSKCEEYLKAPKDGEVAAPYDLRRINQILYNMRAAGAKSEVTWLVDRNWKPVVDPGQAYVKAIVDAHWLDQEVLHVRDFKSGREYPSHRKQLELYSILGLLEYPSAGRAESAATYIDGGYSGQDASIIRPMLPKLIDLWSTEIETLESDDDFIANPGAKCKWCPFRRSNGGPCEDSAKVGQ